MKQTKPNTSRLRAKGINLDIAWIFLFGILIVAIWAATLIWREIWYILPIVVLFGIFLLWVGWKGNVFGPWAYQVRRAQVARRQSKWAKMDRHIHKALKLAERFPPNDLRRGMVLFHVGDLERERLRFGEAETYFLEAADIFLNQKNPRPFEMTVIYNNLAVCHYHRGRNDLAREFYDRGMQTAEQVPSLQRWIEAVCLHNLARLHMDRGQWVSARNLLREAQEVLGSTKGPAVLRHTLSSVRSIVNSAWSELEIHDGDLHEADHHAELALGQADSIRPDGRALQAVALGSLADVRWHQGRMEETEELVEEVLALHHVLTERESPFVSEAYFLLAQVRLSRGNEAEAEKLFRHGLALREQFGFPDTAPVQEHLQTFASLLRRTGRTEEAELMASRARQVLAPVETEAIETGIQEIKTVLPVRKEGIQEPRTQ